MAQSPITTHVLDTMRGKPAGGVPVVLEQKSGAEWKQLAKSMTDTNGRAADLLAEDFQLHPGTFRLTFDTLAYFATSGQPTFYPYVQIVFEIHPETSGQHFHVPLLLSPYGYSTYRGS
jgi:5-hydroxyisourate hydrolase